MTDERWKGVADLYQATQDRTSPLDGFVGSFRPPRVTLLYTCGLVAVAAAMLLLPIIYLLMIGGLAYALWWYGTFVVSDASANILIVALYVSPLVAGAILVFFTLKPFLAERAVAQPRMSLDFEHERLLVAFVERLCALLNAPRPSRIDVDLQPNASASLQGIRSLLHGKIVLTIGLPLVAGLNMRELAGVLAHELSHFSQGAGMRLTYIISSINRWFARVAFERDKWDEWLEKSTNTDFRFAAAMGLARRGVAVTRRILKGLLWIGHAISCFLLRQMEYDADRCQALLSGSDTFESCSRRTYGMTWASQMVGRELQRSWAQRELPDDLPYLMAQRFRHAGQLIDRLVEDAVTKPTRWFDTHPAVGDRIVAVRNLDTRGVFRDDRPASYLFANFTELSRTATRQFYEKHKHLALDGIRLVPSDTLLVGVEGVDRQARALDSFFEGTPFAVSPLPSTLLGNTGLSDDLFRRLIEARRHMRHERARTKDVMRRYEGTGVRLINLTVARHLTAVGAELSQLPINLRLEEVEKAGVEEAIARASTRASFERDGLLVELAALERAAVDRIETALALLPHTPGPLIATDTTTLLGQALQAGALLNALDSTPTAMRELYAGAFTVNVLEKASATFLDAAAVKSQISKLHEELLPILHRVLANAADLSYPLADAGDGTVAAHLGDPGELTVSFALPRLLLLREQCFARVIEIVIAVEDAWQQHLATFEATSEE
jgi:Zn-dependent protease with chaperone function